MDFVGSCSQTTKSHVNEYTFQVMDMCSILESTELKLAWKCIIEGNHESVCPCTQREI